LLARHLGAFGEIRITRLEPETTVAWEGERASGTVTIEPSSWGTKVTMTATLADVVEEGPAEPVAEEEPVAEPEPAAEPEPVAEVEQSAEPEPIVEPEPVPAPPATLVRRPGLIARLAAWFKGERPPQGEPAPALQAVAEPEPEAAVEPEPPVAEPEPPVAEPEPPVAEPALEPGPEPEVGSDPEAALDAALDSLGQAHHRPFSHF